MEVQRVSNTNTVSYNAPTNVKIASTIGALLSTSAYVYSLAKHKSGKNIFHKISNVELGIKEGILLCTSSVIGGLVGGLLTDRKENTTAKLHETAHQMIGNNLIPFSCLAISNICTRGLNKGIRTVVGIGVLIASTFLGHNVTDKLMKTPKSYKVGIVDFAPDMDDWVLAASTVMNNKWLYRITATVCPFTYAILGAKTGLAQNNTKRLDTKV